MTAPRFPASRCLGVGLALATLATSACAPASPGRCPPGTGSDREVDVDVDLVLTSGDCMMTRIQFGDLALRSVINGRAPAPAALQFFRASVHVGRPQKLVVSAELSKGRDKREVRTVYEVPGLTRAAVIRVTLGKKAAGYASIKVDVDGRELAPFDLAQREWTRF